MPQKRLKLVVAYDGTEYSGFQVQKNADSIQGRIEEALSRMHKRAVRIAAAGRTDAGVHARGQVISFDSEIEALEEAAWPRAINTYLPPAIQVRSAKIVDDEFHARYSARARVYTYHCSVATFRDPFTSRYLLRLRRVPDLRALNAYAGTILGRHDFATFAGTGDQSASSVREVIDAAWFATAPGPVFKVAANAFLWKMVRSLVGTMLDLESRGAPVEDMRRILESRRRREAGPTAPAHGLFLDRVVYPGESEAEK